MEGKIDGPHPEPVVLVAMTASGEDFITLGVDGRYSIRGEGLETDAEISEEDVERLISREDFIRHNLPFSSPEELENFRQSEAAKLTFDWSIYYEGFDEVDVSELLATSSRLPSEQALVLLSRLLVFPVTQQTPALHSRVDLAIQRLRKETE